MLELEELGDVANHLVDFVHGSGLIDVDVMLVVIHDDCLGVGGSSYEFIFGDIER